MPAPQDSPTKACYWSPGNQHTTVDVFAVPVNVETGPVLLLFLLLLGLLVMPQGPCPLCQRIRKTLVCPGMRRAGEKQFDIGIAVGQAASGNPGHHGSCVGAQIPGPGQPPPVNNPPTQHHSLT